ncbi:unnamed protein product, partial [Allacma fusca]
MNWRINLTGLEETMFGT